MSSRVLTRTLGVAAAILWTVATAAAGEQTPPEATALGEAPVLTAGPLEYRPGRGLRLGPTGLVLGGFTNVKAETTDEAGGEFALDNLNFFVIFDRYTRFRAVAELQLKDIFVAAEDGTGTQDFAFDVRRLFGDFTLLDELHLRAGTFLTPVGYWNLLLAPPLTWTTEPPQIVEETFFQATTTGLMLHGSRALGEGHVAYALFSQFLKPLEDDPDLEPPDHTLGARLTYDPAPGWSMGLSYQAAELNARWSYLSGAHARWQPRRGEILAELYFQDGLDGRDEDEFGRSQWGTYLQGVFEIHRPFYLVGRYEYLDPRAPHTALHLFTFGAAWKPFPFMAIKVEYRFGDRTPEESDPDGFFSSFTTFF